ncbi:MAG: 4-alpha-glucanotransferase [Cyanobacteria bacterium SIG26]|nr:4-alpha-glucanotransferase [Cyanobacteria bacterium SIG26]
MKVSAIKSKVSFGAAIEPKDLDDFKKVRDEAKALVGQTGKSIFIVHDACLPQSPTRNTGVANLASQESLDFLKYMQTYTGCNMIEVLPQGQYGNALKSGLYCAYTGTAFSLGNNQINPALLTTERYGKLLTADEFNQIVNANDAKDADEIVNYKNVMPNDSKHNEIIKIAHERFKKLDENNELKQRYKKYVEENDEWLKIPNSYESDTEFYKFKQFLADSHLKDAKTEINNLGMKLCGDCLINFSEDERKAFPKAFLENEYIGSADWRITTLNYDTLTDPTSDTAKLLKMKVQLFAKRYDAIRFDVGWAYLNPLIHKTDKTSYGKDLGDSVLKFIENAVKEVKGEDFDLKDLMYEFEGGREFKPNSSELHDAAKKRVKIYSSVYMNDKEHECWGTNEAFLKRGWDPDYYVIGPGNHDPQPLKQIALNMPDLSAPENEKYHKDDAIKVLSRIFGVDSEKLKDPVEFAKAKWAEPMTARNNQMFYMDVFGREERFNMQDLNLINDNSRGLSARKNFAYKISAFYKNDFHKAISDGFGFNIMDSLERAFRLKKLDTSHPELYSKIIKYRDILLKPAEYIEEIANELEHPAKKMSTLLSDNIDENTLAKTITEKIEKTNKVKNTKSTLISALIGVGMVGIIALVEYKNNKQKKQAQSNKQIKNQEIKPQTYKPDISMKKFLA